MSKDLSQINKYLVKKMNHKEGKKKAKTIALESAKYKGYDDKFPGNKPMFHSKELAKINSRSLDYYRTKKK